jgi:hypothetical protein
MPLGSARGFSRPAKTSFVDGERGHLDQVTK